MAIPATTVEVAFDGGPFSSSYTWTDVTDWVKGFKVRRGRSYELDRVEAGTLSLTLDNADGRFTPGRSASPHHPNVLPRRRIRIRTANLLSKDVSTGGDVTRSAAAFSTTTAGTSKLYTTAAATSGAGSIQVTLGNNGTAEFASSVHCGYVASVSSGWSWFSTTTLVPTGLARVVPGSVYTASGRVQLKAGSPATGVKVRVRWYNSAGAFISSSGASGTHALTAGSWVTVSIANRTAPANAAWAGIEIGTVNGDNNAVVYVDELQVERSAAVSTWVPGGSLFYGYVEKWTVALDSLTPVCEVSATDGFSVLGTTELHTPYQQAVVASSPLGSWPLTDSAGSTTVANLADDSKAGRLVASKYGGATAAFGAPSVVAKDPGTAYSSANVSGTAGTVVDVNDGGRRRFTLGSELTVAFWCLPTRPASGHATLFQAWGDNALRLVSFRLDVDGYLEVETGFADGSSTYCDTSEASVTLSTSVPSFIVATVTNGNTTIYVNGNPVGGTNDFPTTNDLRDMKWSSLAGRQAGSIYTEYANGRYGHLAIWGRRITGSEITDFWKLGSNSGAEYTEDEANRISRLSTYADFNEGLALDAGLSTLLSPSWEAGTTALEEVQKTAEDASGYAFMDGDGRLTFHSRSRRQSGPLRYTLSDSSGLPYESGLTFEMDDDRVINEVAYQRTGGISATVRDGESVDLYGRKTKSLELRLAADSSVTDAAYSLLYAYSEPVVRCAQVALNVSAVPALFPIALGIEIGDRVKLGELPSAAPATSYEFYVEAIDTDVQADGTTPKWVTVLSLSPAAVTDVWVLEDTTNGFLDSSVGLAY